MTFLPVVLYGSFADATRAHGLDPLTDQRLAGAAMCFLEVLVFGIAFLVVFLSALAREDQADRLEERVAREA